MGWLKGCPKGRIITGGFEVGAEGEEEGVVLEEEQLTKMLVPDQSLR